MGKAEIEASIRSLENEIRNLEASRNLYQNMNTKINETITKLTSAKGYANKSYTSLGQYYQSKISDQKVKELENEYTNIDNLIKSLNAEVLQASYTKINAINSNINNERARIGSLREELQRIIEEERRERERREQEEREASERAARNRKKS